MKFSVIFSGLSAVLGLWCVIPVSNAASKSPPNTPSEVVSAVVEPNYCDPAKFDEKEIPIGGEGEGKALARAHAFRLGKVTMVGLGVGDSPVHEVIELSKRLVPEGKSLNKCTWYLNHPKKESDKNKKLAAVTFSQRDIFKNPMLMTEEEATATFMKVLETSFDRDPINFTSCAADQNYLALGCNEMMHRGPTVFGMILAFSGCTPNHALEIVNQTWGLNHVKRKLRLAVLQKAYELGEERKESRKRLSDAFSSQ